MKIRKVSLVEGLGGYWNIDHEAVKRGAVADGFTYKGKSVTEGFDSIIQPAKAISMIIKLSDGGIALGDGVWVCYGGRVKRESFTPIHHLKGILEKVIAPRLEGREVTSFRELAGDITSQSGIPSILGYGLTQALLDAVAKSRGKCMAEVLAEEYGLSLAETPIPLLVQCGEDWYRGVDKCILRRIPYFPHGNINTGERFEELPIHIKWTVKRIQELGGGDYNPTLHYDLYGHLGYFFKNNLEEMADYILELEGLAEPYSLQLEDPVSMNSQDEQIRAMKELRKALRDRGSRVRIVADEWAPSLEDVKKFVDAGASDIQQVKCPDLGGINHIVEAILYCKDRGVKPYLGGSCTETDISARATVHIALATKPEILMAKPGMGVDEAVSITQNEIMRTLHLIKDE